jgi:hypothetical protein
LSRRHSSNSPVLQDQRAEPGAAQAPQQPARLHEEEDAELEEDGAWGQLPEFRGGGARDSHFEVKGSYSIRAKGQRWSVQPRGGFSNLQAMAMASGRNPCIQVVADAIGSGCFGGASVLLHLQGALEVLLSSHQHKQLFFEVLRRWAAGQQGPGLPLRRRSRRWASSSHTAAACTAPAPTAIPL